MIRPAIVALILFTLLTGVLYPLLITGMAQVVFPSPANGSLITNAAGAVVGSRLIGQEFDQPQYFWGRLSATGPAPYNAAASSGSNLGPLNPSLIGEDGNVQTADCALQAADKAAGVANDAPLPVDLVTASGSGLDPQISPAAAAYQAARVAAVRGAPVEEMEALIAEAYGRPHVRAVGRSPCQRPAAQPGAGRALSSSCAIAHMIAQRPDPDTLLSFIQKEEARQQRGKLKIFFGMVAGVGKTYAMLQAGHQRHGEGVDVVVGYVETHGGAETEALLQDMEVLPRRKLEYRGTRLRTWTWMRCSHAARSSRWSTNWRTPMRPASATASATRT